MSHSVARSSDGTKIAFDRRGTGDIALVFVHGMACNKSHWNKQIEGFADRYTCVAADLCGHGQSGGTRDALTGEAFADDVIAVIESLSLDHIVLLGHSMGGYVIPIVADRLGERVVGLIGVDTWSALDSEYRAPDLSAFETAFEPAMSGFVTSMFSADADPQLIERVRREMCAAGPEVVLNILTNVGGSSVAETLRRLDVPKHSIGSDTFTHKSADVAVRYRIMLHKMDNVGHFMMLERPDRFNALLKEILASIEAG